MSKTEPGDLHKLFEIQCDEEANYLAAFTSKDPFDKAAYLEKFTKLLADPSVNICTIKADQEIAGSVAKYLMAGEPQVTYWIDKKFWRNGIATEGLQNFLKIETIRPIYGRVAFDNYASQKVLQKCGFNRIGRESGFANARNAEIEEFIYMLAE